MEDLIAKTKAKVVAEKQARADLQVVERVEQVERVKQHSKSLEVEIDAKVKKMLLQIEKASDAKQSTCTLKWTDEVDKLAVEKIAKFFKVETKIWFCYSTNTRHIEYWTVSW